MNTQTTGRIIVRRESRGVIESRKWKAALGRELAAMSDEEQRAFFKREYEKQLADMAARQARVEPALAHAY